MSRLILFLAIAESFHVEPRSLYQARRRALMQGKNHFLQHVEKERGLYVDLDLLMADFASRGRLLPSCLAAAVAKFRGQS